MEEGLPLNIMTLDALGQGQRVLGGFRLGECWTLPLSEELPASSKTQIRIDVRRRNLN